MPTFETLTPEEVDALWLKPPPRTPARDAIYAEMYESGMSLQELMSFSGLGRLTLRKALRSRGVVIRKPGRQSGS